MIWFTDHSIYLESFIEFLWSAFHGIQILHHNGNPYKFIMCFIFISVCLLLPQRVTEESTGYSVPGRHLCGYTHKSWLMQSFNSYPEVAIWISKYGTHHYSAGKYFEPLISEYYLYRSTILIRTFYLFPFTWCSVRLLHYRISFHSPCYGWMNASAPDRWGLYSSGFRFLHTGSGILVSVLWQLFNIRNRFYNSGSFFPVS